MRRMHLVELHETSWFPETWRRMFRDGLGRSQNKFGVFVGAIPKVREVLDSSDCRRVLDLCSGSGDVTARFQELLAEGDDSPEPVQFILSDLFPDVRLFRRFQLKRPGQVEFHATPVNALEPPDIGPHFRSMFASLHHFRPHEVRKIMEDAARKSEGIFIMESTSRSWKSLMYSLPLPLTGIPMMSFLLRPWRPHHLLWGLLIPVLPVVIFIDSLVSSLRSYTPEELTEMAESIDVPDFVWSIGTVPMKKVNLQMTYVIGRRVRATED